ncbi:hypothetical protein [Hymenobacter profundi]|uniref:Uncharacterized protein n=1 Tax=Hymenobacter profundi TaxID=1982110 RepID=A0ABS6X4W4_9BACT|nr:hypothetical protein [Hymenobacter profundi]MBW3130880.1 hypothetical protein [Hymenobacter profundi]
MPHLPRWQQYLLLVGALLTILTGSCLHSSGAPLSHTFSLLALPGALWWPQPAGLSRQVMWWVAIVFLFGLTTALLMQLLL